MEAIACAAELRIETQHLRAETYRLIDEVRLNRACGGGRVFKAVLHAPNLPI
jgi:hypothetical protein